MLIINARLLAVAQDIPRLLQAQVSTAGNITWSYLNFKNLPKKYNQARRLSLQEPDSAMQIMKEGLAYSAASNYYFGMALFNLGLAQCYNDQKEYQKAGTYFRETAALLPLAHNVHLSFAYYLNAAHYHIRMSHRDTAIQLLVNAHTLISNYPYLDSNRLWETYINLDLASCFLSSEQDPEIALKYLDKVRQIIAQTRMDITLPRYYAGLGSVWSNLYRRDSLKHSKGYQTGLQNFHLAVQEALKQQDTTILINTYQNMAGVYNNLGLFDSSHYYIRLIDRFPKSYLSENNTVAIHYIEGNYFYRTSRYLQAIKSYEKALELSDFYQVKTWYADILSDLANSYEHTSEINKAYRLLKKSVVYKDSLDGVELVYRNKQLEARFASRLKDQEIAVIAANMQLQKSQIERQHTWIYLGGAIITLLLGFILLLYRLMRQKRRLQSRKIQDLQQKQQISSLKAMIEGEEKERARLARELHDGIVSQLAATTLHFTEMQIKHPELLYIDDFKNGIRSLSDASADLRNAAHNLMPEVLLHEGILSSLALYCEKLGRQSGILIHFSISGNLPEINKEASLYLYRICQELLQNILKHARATEAIVQINVFESLFMLTIEDNGRGINPAQLESDHFLKTVKLRIEYLKGQYHISSSGAKGTSINMEFNLDNLVRKPGYPASKGFY